MSLTKQSHDELLTILTDDKPFTARARALEWLNQQEIVEEPKKQRTDPQNRALHKWLQLVAAELDREGHTLQDVVKAIQHAEIRPNTENLKEVMWKPYQLAAFNKESTTQLETNEVDKVYEGLNKFLGEHFHLHIPFPKRDLTPDYPEYSGPPTV